MNYIFLTIIIEDIYLEQCDQLAWKFGQENMPKICCNPKTSTIKQSYSQKAYVKDHPEGHNIYTRLISPPNLNENQNIS